ncbi:MAG TPA: hypothetical protein VF777_14535 [Phycisphaerales bacterium]
MKSVPNIGGAAWAIGLSIGLAVASVARGQSLQTLPPANNAIAGNSFNSLPIGNFVSGTHQTMYGADLLTGIPVGSVITGMQLRLAKSNSTTFPGSALTISRYDVTLASSALTPATMSSTFATNLLNPVAVRSGPLQLAAGAYQWINSGAGVPEPWGPVIPFTTGYRYAGGPLVIQWRVVSPSNTFNAFADLNSGGGSQRFAYTDINPDATTATSVSPTAGGVIVRLTFTPPPVDLAKGVTKVIVADRTAASLGNTSEGVLTWFAPYTQVAVASETQFDTIGPGSDFVGMAWRMGNVQVLWPAAPANFGQLDVQLSRSQRAPGSLSNTIATNVGADAVAVRSGAFSFPVAAFTPRGSAAVAPFGPEIPFTNAYTYRGGPMLSVVRHSGQGSGEAGFMDAITIGNPAYNSDVQAWQQASISATSATASSSYLATMYSVDAGTSSPLNQLSPGADQFGFELVDAPVLQTVLSASELRYIPVGSVIDSLWLRQIASAAGAAPASTVTSPSFEVSVSSATQQPDAIGTSFASNEGADKVVVYSGGWSLAAGSVPSGTNGNFGKLVQFQMSFVYKGGPLCVTIRHAGLSGTIGSMEALFGTTGTNRSVWAGTPGSASGSFYSAGYTGTALKLGYIPSVMTPGSIATAEGADGYLAPTLGSYVLQTIVSASDLSTIDLGSVLTGLSLRHSSSGGGPSFPEADTTLGQFDISIAPASSPPLGVSSTFASNIGPGEVVVRSGFLRVPANAYPASGSPAVPGQNAWYVPFSRAYVYNGGDLCVTIRGQGILTASGSYDCGSTIGPRSATIYNYSSSAATSGTVYRPLGIRFAFTPRSFCPADLNNDGVVTDNDFTIFAAAYNILDCADPLMPLGCPGDLNFDRVVDDLDFSVFATAYDTLLCP